MPCLHLIHQTRQNWAPPVPLLHKANEHKQPTCLVTCGNNRIHSRQSQTYRLQANPHPMRKLGIKVFLRAESNRRLLKVFTIFMCALPLSYRLHGRGLNPRQHILLNSKLRHEIFMVYLTARCRHRRAGSNSRYPRAINNSPIPSRRLPSSIF